MVAALAVFRHSAGYQRFYTERAVALVGHVVDDQEFHGVVMEGLQFLVHSCFLEQTWSAALDCHGSKDTRNHCCNEFKDLRNFGPTDFLHKLSLV